MRRCEARLGERVADVGHDVALVDLPRREVDGDRQLPARLRSQHARAVPAALVQHPPADRQDQARLLGDRDELVRRDHAALRVAPPQERLHAGRLAVLQAHDGLVVQLEPAFGDRPLEIAAQLQAGEHPLVHLWLEEPVAALAVALGDVRGGVGVADQLVGRRPVARASDRDADAAARHHLAMAGAHGRGQRLEHALGRVGRLLDRPDVLEEEGELVAAEAGGGCPPRARIQAAGHLDTRSPKATNSPGS